MCDGVDDGDGELLGPFRAADPDMTIPIDEFEPTLAAAIEEVLAREGWLHDGEHVLITPGWDIEEDGRERWLIALFEVLGRDGARTATVGLAHGLVSPGGDGAVNLVGLDVYVLPA